MSRTRLRKRVPSADFVAIARLREYRLKFHKVSKDGSGKCDAEWTGNCEDYVLGVVFTILDCEKPVLDQKEGLGLGYNEKDVNVFNLEGEALKAHMYYATNIDSNLKPYQWYKEHVLTGAEENNLDPNYINFIKAVEAIDDLNADRKCRELSIYSKYS